MVLNGNNSYSGSTKIQAGILEANHLSALGTSQIKFDGGILRYGANAASHGYATQFAAVDSGKFARIDTHGNSSIVFNAGITGNGGLEKLGSGTLTLGTGNSYTGETIVRAGILKAAPGTTSSGTTTYVSEPFGQTSLITIESGATLDLNGNGYGNGNSRRYKIEASGLGVDGLATIWNSGIGLTNTAAIEEIKFNTDISFGSDTRFDISNATSVLGGTNTFYKHGTGELAWSAMAGSSVGHIDVVKGTFTIQSTALGSSSHQFHLRAGTTLQYWVNNAWTLQKNVIAYGNVNIRTSGSNPTNTNDIPNDQANTGVWANYFNLTTGTATFISNSGFRTAKYKGQIYGAAAVTFTGSTTNSLVTPGYSQTSTHYLLNDQNAFSGGVNISDVIVRLSDETFTAGEGGTLGSTSNSLNLNATTNDGRAILDLHGTSQTIGALNNTGAGVARIQNRRAGTISTLTVGQSNVDGSFAGIIEDQSSTFKGATISSDGATGKIAFEKVGTARQILTNTNTFTGGLRVRNGELQIGTGATGTSTARAGNSAFTIDPNGILSGNGTVGMAGLVNTNQAGGKIRAGTYNQTAAQQLQIAGSLNNFGIIELDIFSTTLGSGNNSNSDSLLFLNDSLINLQGTLSLTDKTTTSNAWTIGTWFRILDWTHVSTLTNREVEFSSWILPTLAPGLAWDTSELGTTGRIIVAVPEPSRAILLLGSLFAFIAHRKRKGR